MKDLVQIDHEMTGKIRSWGKPYFAFWKFMAAESIYGYVVISIPLVLTGMLVWWQILLCFLTTYFLANVIQRIIKRNRPDFEKLTGYKMWIHTYSYPSGHATMSAGLAAAIADFTSFPNVEIALVVAIVVFLLAFLIGIARLIVGVHYLTDVCFGWVLGFVVAWTYAAIFGL